MQATEQVFKTIVRPGRVGRITASDSPGHRARQSRQRPDRHRSQRIAAKGGADLYANEDEIQAEVRKQADELSAQGLEARVEMATVTLGGPAHAIAEIAERAQADLIVVGTRGHSPVSGLLLGSVTQRLLHIADRPVLAVPPPA